MKMTAEEFDQSITMHPKMLEWFSKDKTPEEIEEIKKFRLALGMIIGTDIPGGSTQERWHTSWSVGPSGEKAWVDRFAVSTRMVPMILGCQHVLGSINYLKASAVVKDLYQFENATESSKDLFLFLVMKLSSR